MSHFVHTFVLEVKHTGLDDQVSFGIFTILLYISGQVQVRYL